MTSAKDLMADLASRVDERYKKANLSAKLWSTAYHGSGILSILASAAAAFVATANLSGLSGAETTWIAALSGSAATLTAISTFAGFSRKWRVNRTTRTALFRLQLDLAREGETPGLCERFGKILMVHDAGISGAESG